MLLVIHTVCNQIIANERELSIKQSSFAVWKATLTNQDLTKVPNITKRQAEAYSELCQTSKMEH